MTLVRYSYPSVRPFASVARSPLADLEGEIGRFFQSTFGETDSTSPTARIPVDLYEDKDNTYVRAELPGVNRDDITIELVDGALNLAATRKTKILDREDSVSLARSVSVPDAAVQADKITAAYENGVLTVTLPKREAAKPRTITIN